MLTPQQDRRKPPKSALERGMDPQNPRLNLEVILLYGRLHFQQTGGTCFTEISGMISCGSTTHGQTIIDGLLTTLGMSMREENGA